MALNDEIDLSTIPKVDILARTVPAGLYGGQVRLTLALRPLRPTGDGVVPVSHWPSTVDGLFDPAKAGMQVQIHPIPDQTTARKPEVKDENTTAVGYWSPTRGDLPRVNDVWCHVVPRPVGDGQDWQGFVDGLEALSEDGLTRANTDEPPEPTVCLSGREGDIAILAKMARAYETLKMAVAEHPDDAADELEDQFLGAAQGVLANWPELKTLLDETLNAETAGDDQDTVGEGVTNTKIAGERRKMIIDSVLNEVKTECANSQKLGSELCDLENMEDLAKGILNAEENPGCACEAVKGSLGDIYESILDLQKRFLLANIMGDEEFAQIEESDKPTDDGKPGEYEAPDEKNVGQQFDTAFTEGRLFSLDEMPDLGRLFRTFVDVALPGETLDAILNGATFFYIRLAPEKLATENSNRNSVWTLAKAKREGGKIVDVWPATREEMVLHLTGSTESEIRSAVSLQDGVVLLGRKETGGKPCYELVSADVQAAARDLQSRSDRAFNPPPDEEDKEGLEPSQIRSGGLTVVHFKGERSLSRQIGAAQAREGKDGCDVVLDAEDLLTGHVPYFGILAAVDEDKTEPVWYRLSGRTITWTKVEHNRRIRVDRLIAPLYRDGEREVAQAAADRVTPQAKRLGGKSDGEKGQLIAQVSEAEFTFTGEPVGLDTTLRYDAERIDPNVDIPIGREYGLAARSAKTTPIYDRDRDWNPANPDQGPDDDDLVAALRYGESGRIGYAASFLGGVGLGSQQAADAFSTIPQAAIPPQDDPDRPVYGRRYLRSEAVAPPSILISNDEARDERRIYAGAAAGGAYQRSTSKLVVLRSTVSETGTIRTEGPQTVTRYILPPVLALADADQHGVFDLEKPFWWQTSRRPRMVTAADLPEWRNAYHKRTNLSRPQDGIRNLDYNAGYGGAPVLVHETSSIGEAVAPVRAEIDDGTTFLDKARRWSRAMEKWLETEGPKEPKDQAERPPQPQSPSGDAIFRRKGTGVRTRSLPFYADPMASELVLRLREPWTSELSVGGIDILSIDIVQAADYPDFPAVALAVTPAGKDTAPWLEDKGTKRRNGIAYHDVTLHLPPGRDYALDTWFRPKPELLANCSELVDTAATIAHDTSEFHDLAKALAACAACAPEDKGCGLLGWDAPSPEALSLVANALYDRMEMAPLPEIGRVTTLEVRHAVTRPTIAPSLSDTPLRLRRVTEETSRASRPADWTETASEASKIPDAWLLGAQDGEPAAEPGGIDVDLGGFLRADLPSTGTIEIAATAIAVKGGPFDDPDRTRGARSIELGDYPKALPKTPSEQVKLQRALDIYGFNVFPDGTVSFLKSSSLWAQFSGVPPTVDGSIPDKPAYVSLHALFARPEDDAEAATAEPPDTAGAPPASPSDVRINALFADMRARRVELSIKAISRFYDDFTKRPSITGGVFRRGTPYPTAAAKHSLVASPEELTVWLPASERPARPVRAAEAHPAPVRQALSRPSDTDASAMISESRRDYYVRLWLERPWFTSGEDEKLGIVIWPPVERKGIFVPSLNPAKELFLRPSVAETAAPHTRADYMRLDAFEDRYMVGASRFVSRWGSDPTEGEPKKPHRSWKNWIIPNSVFADFDFATLGEGEPALRNDAMFVPNVAMPIPGEGEDEPETQADVRAAQQRYLNVDLLTYAPRFDIEREQWYVDVALDPGPMVMPFIRLGVVRYQPHAPRDLQLSEPTEPYEFAILPSRRARLDVVPDATGENAIVTVRVQGPATMGDHKETLLPKRKLIRDAWVRSTMVLRLQAVDRNNVLRIDAETMVDGEPHRQLGATWTGKFRIPARAFDVDGIDIKVHIEERAYRMAGTYSGRDSETDSLIEKSLRYLAELEVPKPDFNKVKTNAS